MMTTLLDIVLRSAVVYIVILLGLRLIGKKHVAQLSTIDLVLILLISNSVQNAMVGNDSSLLGGIVAAATLLVLNIILTKVFFRYRGAETLLEGVPTLLIHAGAVIPAHLQSENITEEELERAIREHGIEKVSEVKTAIMESDGTISIIAKSGGAERRIESFKHRRMKYRLRKE
jgi:uncharacterized membrane protein YcaP (DUF421 family)